MSRKLMCLILMVVMAMSTVPAMADNGAEEDFYYLSVESAEPVLSMSMPGDVTKEMCQASYWYDKAVGGKDLVLMEQNEISQVNQECLAASDTKMYDLENMKESYDADALGASLSNPNIPSRAYYLDGEQIDNEAYFGAIYQDIADTAYTGSRMVQYAVCTKRAEMRDLPLDDILGYSETDPDDEMQSSALLVNEPFVIKQTCQRNGNTYYWGYSSNCTGWVNGNNLGICADKEEWMDAWKVDPEGKDFLVVTQNKIVTEASIQTAYCSEVKLTFGTLLKLVPEEEIPKNIGERNDWYNHVVYLPTREEDGSYVKRPALISMNCSVSEGYLPFTQKNVLDVAFSCLGDRYGWGGMLDATDCTLYSRFIYRCFGFELPRNTTWQQCIPGKKIDLEGMSDEAKYQLLKQCPAGTLMYFPGHCMVYVGTEGDQNYVISNTGSVSDSQGDLNVEKVYSCILTPLNVRRANGSSWLTNMKSLILVSSPKGNEITATNISKTYSSKERVIGLKASATYGNMSYTSDNPSVSVDKKGKVTIPAKFLGTVKITISVDGTKVYEPAKKTITLSVKTGKGQINSLTSKKKDQITLTWKKVSGAAGYQIQYSASKEFTESTKKSVSADKRSKTLKLDQSYRGKKCYVRIRTYYKDGSKKVYSSWSQVKHCKVKKSDS